MPQFLRFSLSDHACNSCYLLNKCINPLKFEEKPISISPDNFNKVIKREGYENYQNDDQRENALISMETCLDNLYMKILGLKG